MKKALNMDKYLNKIFTTKSNKAGLTSALQKVDSSLSTKYARFWLAKYMRILFDKWKGELKGNPNKELARMGSLASNMSMGFEDRAFPSFPHPQVFNVFYSQNNSSALHS